MSTNPFARRFAYDTWANREALNSIRAAGEAAPARAVELIAHIVGGQRVWLGRLGQPSGDAAHPVWASLPLDETDSQLAELALAWPDVLARFSADALDRPVAYTTLRGEPFTSTPGDIFEHLLLHAHYHRGQIALLLGRAGLTPAATDFILWARAVEPGA